MSTYNFRTYTQSSGPESFDGGVVALDVIHLTWSEVLATFSGIATGDSLNIRQHSGLRQYVPELCYVYWDNNFTAGELALVIDGVTLIAGGPITSSTAGRATAGGGQLSTPVNATFTTASTGGTLADSTSYYYRVSALDGTGETLASTETFIAVSSGTATNTVTVKWGAVAGATGYKVYGRSTGAELLMATVGEVTQWVDNGSVTPSGALPGSNTTARLDTEYGTAFSTVTADTGSTAALFMTALPTGSSGNIYVQIATRPAQA